MSRILRLRAHGSAVLIASAMLLCGCTGGSRLPAADDSAAVTTPPAQSLSVFGELPSPAEILRGASAPPADTERYREGSSYAQNSVPNRVASGTFSPNWQPGQPLTDAAWAFYNFTNMTDYAGAKRVRCLWSDSAPASGNLYIGLGDFNRDRWVWFSAESAGDVVLPSFTPYLGPGGRMLVAVVLTGNSGHSLGHILLGDNIAPFLSIATDLDPNPLLNTGPRTVNIDCSNSESIGSPIASFDFDWQGDGTFDELGNSDGITSFNYSPGTYELTVRLTTEEGQQQTQSREFVIINPANQPPLAGIDASVSSGDAPLDVDFDPGLSSDNDGSIIKYEWDLNNDGSYELSHTEPVTVNYVYGMQGSQTVGLRVTDNDLAQDSHSVQVTVSSGWQSYAVDSGLSLIDPLSACVSGLDNSAFPCVAYGDAVNDHMVFKSGSANGQNWSAQRLVADNLEDKGDSPSLVYSIATDSLMLAFGQYDSGNTNNYSQYFAKSTDASGSSWNFPVLVAGSATDAGSASSLYIVNNLPCIAAVIEPDSLGGGSRLVYFQANDNSGTSWQTPVEVMAGGVGKRFGSPALGVEGSGLFRQPLIAFSYESEGQEQLAISLATGLDGNAWHPPSFAGVMRVSSTDMEIVQGFPTVVTGSDGSSNNLGYIRADAAEGSAWTSPISAPSKGSDASLIVYDNKPAICFTSNEGSPRLCVVQSGDINGNTWAKPMVIDNSGYPGKASMVDVNGVPMILYHEGTGGNILCAVWD